MRSRKRDEDASVDPRIRGRVIYRSLDLVKPNPWNPNRMPQRARESLRKGLQEEGWLASFALLVWGTNERGEAKNIIIDGEHRWTEGKILGFVEAPMVFLYDLTEAKARALTVKLIERHGKSEDGALATLLRGLPPDLLDATSLGLDDARFAALTDLGLPKGGGGASNGTPEGVDPRAAWTGMPDFDQQDKTAARQVVVNFKTNEDALAFGLLIGQPFTDKTRSIWHPKAEIERCMDKEYAPAEGDDAKP